MDERENDFISLTLQIASLLPCQIRASACGLNVVFKNILFIQTISVRIFVDEN